MKSLSLWLFCLLFITACGKAAKRESTNNNAKRSVVGGQKIHSIDAKDYGPMLKLTFTSPDAYTYSCSAVHIGKGWILTANHCVAEPFARDGRMPYLTVNQYARRTSVGPLSPEYYKTYTPKATSKRLLVADGVSYYLQNPDLTAIKLEGQFANALVQNQKVVIPTEELIKEDETQLLIAGFGETYPNRKDYGTLFTAPVYLWNRIDNFFQLSQEDSKNKHYAAALPGDSGGPLFIRNQKNEMVVYGIFSTYNTLKFANGTYSTDNDYTRTEKGAGADWLKLLLERI